jgi:hypothetical protein
MELSVFDNDLSILYKFSQQFGVPVKYIYSYQGTGENAVKGKRYLPFLSLITKNKSPIDIYNFLSPYLDDNDIFMLFVVHYLNQNIDVDKIRENINNLYKEINQDSTIVLFKNNTELQSYYQEWTRAYQKQLEKDLKKLNKILDFQYELEPIQPLTASPFNLFESKILFQPTINNKPISSIQYIDIFNESIVKNNIPYIQYNNKHRYSKVYKLFPYDFNNVILTSTKSSRQHYIYYTIWLGEKTIKESFIEGFYDLESNKFIFTIPVNQEKIIDIVKSSFPNLTFGNHSVIKINGEFSIYNVKFNPRVLLHKIMVDELFSNYLFIDETVKAFPNKKRFTIHYKSMEEAIDPEDQKATGEGYIRSTSSVIVTISQRYAEQNDIVPEGTPYIYVKVKRATNLNVINEFITIFTRLLRIYQDDEDEIEKIYKYYIPEQTETGLEETKEPKKVKTNMLKDLLPVLKYSRKCQGKSKPIVIQENEIEFWKNKTFIKEGEQKQRQILPFPADTDNPVYLVCPNDEKPYPGIQPNTDASSSELFPYLPCCFTTDHMAPGSKKLYATYYGEKKIKKKVKISKTTHKIKLPTKALEFNRIGFIPPILNKALKLYKPDSKEFTRIGVVEGPNSLLDCVLLAIEDINYKQKTTINDKIEYVKNIRLTMANEVNPALLKQELFEYSDQQIMENLRNVDLYLDPSLYYRAVEETFNVNIYVFVPDETDDSQGNMEIPKHKLFYSRPPRYNRKTILIYKNKGSEVDGLLYPQCELIQEEEEKSNKEIRLFNSNMSQLCHNIFITTNKTISYTYNDKDNEILKEENMYSQFNFNDITNNKAIAQFIDNYGKCRALYLKIQNDYITIVIPPSQPENLPEIKETIPVDIDIATEIFKDQQITEVSKNVDDNVIGIWYGYSTLKNGIFIPVNPTNKYITYPLGPKNPLETTGNNVVNRMRYLERVLNFILQITYWLYTIYFKITKNPNIKDFVGKYFAVNNTPIKDSATFYNISKIPRIFPIAKNVEQAILSMHNFAPTMFSETKIIMYSKNFSSKIQSKLNEYALSLIGMDVNIPLEITNYYNLDIYFKQNYDTALFTSEKDLNLWCTNVNRPSNKQIIIRDNVKSEYANLSEPYIYKDENDKLYQVQNVFGGNFMRAINVGLNWLSNKINTGFLTEPYDGNVPVHIIYGITTSFKLTIVQNNSEGNSQYIEIIQYNPERYGALLPI